MDMVEITAWETTEVKIIYLTQEVDNLAYALRVRRFKADSSDSLHRRWTTDGVSQEYECSNYAIESMRDTCEDFVKHVERSLEKYIAWYIDESDWLLRETYRVALGYSDDSTVSLERTLSRFLLTLTDRPSTKSCPKYASTLGGRAYGVKVRISRWT